MVIKLKKIKANLRTVRFSEFAFFYFLNFCIYNLEISPSFLPVFQDIEVKLQTSCRAVMYAYLSAMQEHGVLDNCQSEPRSAHLSAASLVHAIERCDRHDP